MYFIKSRSETTVLVSNTVEPYLCEFPAESDAAAELVVVQLNQPEMLAELAAYRFTFEVAGLLTSDGARIKTDRESQGLIAIAYGQLKGGLIPDTDYKGVNGWQVVTLEEFAPIAKAAAAHERACFRGERLTAEAINAATSVADIEAIVIQDMFQAVYQQAYAEVMGAPA